MINPNHLQILQMWFYVNLNSISIRPEQCEKFSASSWHPTLNLQSEQISSEPTE